MIAERLSGRSTGIMRWLHEHEDDDIRGRRDTATRPRKVRHDKGIRALAEGIILQNIEDLWRPEERKASLAFFMGEGFRVCADAAGLNVPQQHLLIRMIEKAGFEVSAGQVRCHA